MGRYAPRVLCRRRASARLIRSHPPAARLERGNRIVWAVRTGTGTIGQCVLRLYQLSWGIVEESAGAY